MGNEQDVWLQGIGVSPDSFSVQDDGTIVMPPDTITAKPPGPEIQPDGTIVMPPDTITAKPPGPVVQPDGTILMPPDTITAQPPPDNWTFNIFDPSKKPPDDIIHLPPPKLTNPPPQFPPWFWTELPKNRDDTPAWKKWRDAVTKWCKDNHVDPGPVIDSIKDGLNAPDDGKDDGRQPSHKDDTNGPPTDDDD